MSEIKAYSLGEIRPNMIIEIGKRLGYTLTVNEEGDGYFRVNTAPDLTAAHKVIVLQLIDRQGYGSVTP